MKRKLKGKWAIVTGASSGIGLCYSVELARRGCNLIMISNQEIELEERADEIWDEYGVEAYPLALDLTSPGAVEAIDNYVRKKGYDGEIVANNAGIFSFKEVADTPDDKVECFIDLHVAAVTRLSRWFAIMRREKRSGWLLNMSSMSCWWPMPGIALYSATKAYIRVFTRALRYEMKDYGVNVMVACPGGIATDLFGLPENLKRLAVNIGAIAKPETFTRKAVDRMLKGKQQYINGMVNRLAIVAGSLLPTSGRMLIKHKLLDRVNKK